MALLYGRAGRLTAEKRRFPARAVPNHADNRVADGLLAKVSQPVGIMPRTAGR
jgi:hypothetical protein